VTVTAYGDRALRCTIDGLDDAHLLSDALLRAALPGVVAVVPAWRSVVVTLAAPEHRDAARELAASIDLAATRHRAPRMHELTIRYDGPDLHEVATRAGVSVDEAIRRHAAGDYVVAFLGFAPGFPYLTGLDPALVTPRRATPRQSVGAGAVGIADDVTGIYPADSPGGWQIVGHVTATLFDAQRDPPALLAPGDRVRFLPT
jgi:KipI family sensor histidine kinase inhibitor